MITDEGQNDMEDKKDFSIEKLIESKSSIVALVHCASTGYVDLLPCPFCGSAYADYEHDPKCFIGQLYPGEKHINENPDGYRVRCQGKCAASTTWWHEKDQAKKAWNTRT